MTRIFVASAVVAALLAGHAAQASNLRLVTDPGEFTQLVDGRNLTRFGIRLAVSPAGNIEGRAFGRTVTGAWTWQRGFFCRDLRFGSDDLGYNCQQVLVNGDTVRFIADQGAGDHADFRLR